MIDFRSHIIGSDCHDMESRDPNMGDDADTIHDAGAGRYFVELNDLVYQILSGNRSEQEA